MTEGDELVERLPAIAAEDAREDAVDALAGEVERRDDAARHLGVVAEREQADGLERRPAIDAELVKPGGRERRRRG